MDMMFKNIGIYIKDLVEVIEIRCIRLILFFCRSIDIYDIFAAVVQILINLILDPKI